MARRTLLLGLVAALALTTLGAAAEEEDRLPVYEPAVAEVVPGGACTQETRFDAPNRHVVDANGQLIVDKYGLTEDADPPAPGEGTDLCERLRIVFGPIMAKPGQNDVLIQPVTFEKPMYDGYMVRFKPSLFSVDGTPPVEDLHLHHGTWLNAGRGYNAIGSPWLASGEEKTIATWPHRYGLEILGNDTWLFLHMVHNATPRALPVWVSYDIDFVKSEDAQVEQADGEPLLTNTKGVWLDVGGGNFHPETQTYPFNPVFNAHRGFGDEITDQHTLDIYGEHYAGIDSPSECYFPLQNCAMFNSQNNESAQQGTDVSGQPLPDSWDAPTVLGKDAKFPSGSLGPSGEGTLVLMGGHLHNGGLRDEVQLVRDLDTDGRYAADEGRLIHISDAYYWLEDQTLYGPDKEGEIVGGAPLSWDFSMSGVTSDLGWAINVREGDILRLNGVYDSSIGSWYEQMGIVMAWVVPGGTFGTDMFLPGAVVDGNQTWTINEAVTVDPGIAVGAQVPYGPDGELLARTCVPGTQDGVTTVCARGQLTHPHYSASGNHSICPPSACQAFPGADIAGPMIEGETYIGGFTFGPFDQGVTGLSGVPRMVRGEAVTITNLDTADYIWHTLTRCAAPCTGVTSASYPIADGAYQDLIDPLYGSGEYAGSTPTGVIASLGRPDEMDFDSAELGIGLAPSGKVSWTFSPTRTGLYTFFCRIHPLMRGAFRVVDA